MRARVAVVTAFRIEMPFKGGGGLAPPVKKAPKVSLISFDNAA